MAKEYKDLVVGLDIGTAKVMAVVAEVQPSGELRVAGLGMASTHGLKRGVVVNIDATVQSIQQALKEAEMMAACKIASVYTGITGSHIRGQNSTGMVIVRDNREVTPVDVARVVETAKAINIPNDQRLLLVEPQEFIIDGHEVKEPVGMSGSRLEVKVNIVTGAQSAAENILKCVRRCGLEVERLVLNLVFVILFQMSVAGVALATIISQTVSALMVTVLLMKEEGPLRLDLRHLGFHKGALVQILKIGLPAGLQSTVFSLSNVVIQSAVNSFGSTIVAGNSAAANIEGFIYTGMNAFAQAAVTFTSQNVGARRYDNLDRVMRNCLLCAVVVGIVLGGGAYLAGEGLLHFYSTDETVVAAGLARMKVICTSYFLCGIMDTLASCLRGRGYSVLPMIVSLVGSCLLRLVWIATIFQLFRSTTTLYISYPISWLLTASVHLACLLVVRHKMNNAEKPVKIAA